MATVNFSVPEETKRRFNAAFKGRNKSAVVARLMADAVEEERRKARRKRAAAALLRLRGKVTPSNEAEIRRARLRGRP